MNKKLQFLFALTILASLAAVTTHGSGNTVEVCCNPCCDKYDCHYNCNECCMGQCDGYPFFQIRSQGRDSARELVGWQQFVNKYCMEDKYRVFSVAVEYSRSFRPERIAHFLFGNDLTNNCCELLIQGNTPCGQVPDVGGPATDNPKAWFANYFGLPVDYSSKVSFCPKIQNVVVDLNFYWGLDDISEGLYVRLNAPIVWTKWELCMCEKILCTGEDNLPAGYMAETELDRQTEMVPTFAQYMAGGYTFGDMKEPMRYGLINNCPRSKTRLGEVDLSIGYNFRSEEDHHCGMSLYIAAPAGNRPCARYLFEPIVGNGKHWELGVGFSSSYIFWRSKEYDDRYVGIWMEANIAHLFRTRQRRSFDLCGKPNSRYMLLAQMGPNNDLIKLGDTGEAAVTSDYQYNKNLIPAINWSTFNVDVKIPVQADIAVKFGWVRENWTFDLGYNFWARKGEKFCDCCPCDDGKKYVLKGDSYMYGRDGETIVPLPVSQSLADIHMGTNWPQLTGTDNPRTNPRVDNPKLAWTHDNNPILMVPGTSQMSGSYDPLFVSRNQLNLGQSPSAITHKIFAHIGYAWKDRCEGKFIPFIGIGGKAEFAQDNWKKCCSCDDCCAPCGTSCTKTTKSCGLPSCGTCSDLNCNCCYDDQCCCKPRGGLNLWSIWIKGGLSFD